jgi:hypothetical protein
VTSTQGEVLLTEGEASTPAPPVPFLVTPEQTLQLGEGASAVLIYEGSALMKTGPATLTPDAMAAPAATGGDAGGDAIASLMSRGVSTSSVSSSRGFGDGMLAPIPGTRLLELREVRWVCEGCPAIEVQLVEMQGYTALWAGSGEGRLDYSGPPLAPGEYALMLGGGLMPFSIATEEERALLEAAQAQADEALAGADLAARTSARAGLLFHAGMPSEALRSIDEALAAAPDSAALARLRAAYEQRIYSDE